MKDFLRRVLIARDEPWWSKASSEWKISVMHPWCGEHEYSPDFWEERAINLCTYDTLHNLYGLNFLDLMDLDVATFETIENKVHDIHDKQQAALPKELKDQLEQNRKGY